MLGPSGCGKSTLLRMIAGLETITRRRGLHRRTASSTIWSPNDRDIAMVFQNYALYPHMTVYDNMAYGLKNPRHAEGRDRQRGPQGGRRSWNSAPCWNAGRASFPAASASASPWAAPSCATRRSSCSTSRCPTSTPSCAARCGSRSSACSARSASPALYVTHDQLEAMTLADRMMVMNGGVVEQIGTPMEVYTAPPAPSSPASSAPPP